ncbi:transcriptional regulator [Alteribacter lacisalsi]|uniref:Transcriptional regulator n=1 Tax=Alteribacter lacisalsi TaxID=2045244 RepID=A0A2W0HIC8_9BACI|nr:metalloregulator ArsR/SmtB family transcription factor [Alteribacter lacisalsi]PYZ96732.1 transcriptional regulator [Alteribacter lacisalsi]
MADIYRALGDPTRRKIVTMLKENNRTQKELVETFDISQPAVKKHVNILLEEGIVTQHSNGKYRVYSLNRSTLQDLYTHMLAFIGDLLDDQLTDLKNYVEKGERRDDQS